MKELLCREMGNECDAVIVGENDEEILQKTADHISRRHPETEFGQAARNEVKLLIHDA